MKQMRLTMSYYDVIETESTVSGYWEQTAPKVTRKREATCVTEAEGESEKGFHAAQWTNELLIWCVEVR